MKKLIKAIYRFIPFKQPIFRVLRKIWSPSPRIYRHLHFNDVIRVKVEPGKSFRMQHFGFEIENEIFWRGLENGWEKVSVGLWKKLCKEATVILDIGANTGIYSLIAKTLNPAATVYAFEPVERVFQKLQHNCRLNHFDIGCMEMAASNFNGKAIVYDTDDVHALSVTVNKNLHEPGRKVLETEIRTITLQSFIEEKKISRIDLVKIDVETHEPEVLEGFGEYLSRFRPAMLIEILNDEVGARISRLIEGMDYLYFNIDENKGIRQVNKIEHSDYYNYLLCNKATALQLKLISE